MRVIRGLVLAFVAGATACGDGGSGPSGKTKILLTDAPFPYDRVARVDVHIVRVQVAAVADTTSQNQQWITVAEPRRTVNLLELHSGQTTLLGETNVDAGSVGAVRVVINTALSSLQDNGGQTIQVRWPVSGELAIHAYVQSSLGLFAPGTPRNLVIDFDVGRSFEDLYGDGSLFFIPWIRALDEAGTGAVGGVVRGTPSGRAAVEPLPNVAVTVLAGDPRANPGTWWKIATGKTDAQGRYRVAFLHQGGYIVRAEPLTSPGVGCLDVTNVVIGNGETTALDLTLPAAPGSCARQTSGGGGPDSAGTNPGGNTGAVANVTVTVWPQAPVVGDSAGAFANLSNAQGASLYGRNVQWSVSDANVLQVEGVYGQSLQLRVRGRGTATITATSEGVTGSRTVVVP